jgi:threonine dehydratase
LKIAPTAPILADIEAARERIAGVARVTPVYPSETLSRLAGREVLLKAENLQRTGAFKIRGAFNRISLLSDAERAAGVVAASAGNHGQAVAWAAREAGAVATIFVPLEAPMAKVEAARNYGARVEMAGESFEEALTAAFEHAERTGATFIHPYEDEHVIAGQGTLGLELAEQLGDVEKVLVPIGGGGLAVGIALALRATRPEVRVVGVQADHSGFAIADGIAVKTPGATTGPLLDDLLDDVVRVSAEEIAHAIVLLLERAKVVVEGAGAVGVAALLAGKVGGTSGACAVLSGGNIDPTLLISVMRHGLTVSGRYLVLRTRLVDRPGELIKLLQLVATERGNVLSVEHHREGMDLPVTESEVELTLTMRDGGHCDDLCEALRRQGYPVERIK